MFISYIVLWLWNMFKFDVKFYTNYKNFVQLINYYIINKYI